MLTIQAESFSEELLKIAKQKLDYRSVDDAEIASSIPFVKVRKGKSVLNEIDKATKREDIPKILGYGNVALKVSDAPNLTELGFKPTRIATPLPGEKPFAVSWRKGKLHAHRMGPFYLMHQDKHDVSSSKINALRHGIREGVPSIVKRTTRRDPLVRVINAVDKKRASTLG